MPYIIYMCKAWSEFDGLCYSNLNFYLLPLKCTQERQGKSKHITFFYNKFMQTTFFINRIIIIALMLWKLRVEVCIFESIILPHMASLDLSDLSEFFLERNAI